MSPLDVWCPACQSGAGTRCTQPTDKGRRFVRWVHLARETNAAMTDVDDREKEQP